MNRFHREYEITDDRTRVQLDVVHTWLAGSYWTPGISFERVERATENSSMVVSTFRDGMQVGFARVISDLTRFGYFCDVYVEESHRGCGIGQAMVRFALEHPDFIDIDRWLLATKDAHGVYAKLGFEPLVLPERWMQIRRERAQTC